MMAHVIYTLCTLTSGLCAWLLATAYRATGFRLLLWSSIAFAGFIAQLVDLHFFCGYTFGEIAGFRGVSERTIQRDWRKARLLLQHALLDPA